MPTVEELLPALIDENSKSQLSARIISNYCLNSGSSMASWIGAMDELKMLLEETSTTLVLVSMTESIVPDTSTTTTMEHDTSSIISTDRIIESASEKVTDLQHHVKAQHPLTWTYPVQTKLQQRTGGRRRLRDRTDYTKELLLLASSSSSLRDHRQTLILGRFGRTKAQIDNCVKLASVRQLKGQCALCAIENEWLIYVHCNTGVADQQLCKLCANCINEHGSCHFERQNAAIIHLIISYLAIVSYNGPTPISTLVVQSPCALMMSRMRLRFAELSCPPS